MRVPVDLRRERLVEAAIRVMVRDGVAHATTRAIVAEAGMPLGAFHYCFRSKAELFEHVIATITDRTLQRALAVLVIEGSVEERLRAGFRAYWQHVLDKPDEHRLTYELTQYAVRQPALAGLAGRQYEAYLAANTQVIEALVDGAAVVWTVPVPVLARYVTAVIDGLTLLYLNEGDAANAGAALDVAASHLCGLLGPA